MNREGHSLGAVSSVVEHYNDTVGVTGSSPVPPTTFWVYIIQSESTGRYYVGSTDDLEQRLHFHYTGQSHYTARRGPWKLVHSEEFPSRSDAVRREREIKRWKSAVAIRNLLESHTQG
jgi:putative endonuclease